MNNALRLLVTVLLLCGLFSACTTNCTDAVNQPSNEPSTYDTRTNNTSQELRMANDRFYIAFDSVLYGDASLMDSVWSQAEDISDMSMFGGRLAGWKAVDSAFKAEANLKLGGRVECKDLVVVAGKDIGYTVCTIETEDMYYKDNPVHLSLRATNVFRIEQGEWKLFHHQSDLSPQLQKVGANPHKKSTQMHNSTKDSIPIGNSHKTKKKKHKKTDQT